MCANFTHVIHVALILYYKNSELSPVATQTNYVAILIIRDIIGNFHT